jgi:hypothetical protein
MSKRSQDIAEILLKLALNTNQPIKKKKKSVGK